MAAPEIRAIYLVGATSSGKTALALDVAEHVGAEIVSCDSRQLYRGMEIGTAAPTAEERARVRHHLVSCVDPRDRWNAGRFAAAANTALRDIADRGRPALLVGGSGLYVRAVRHGLAELPHDAEVRARLLERLSADGSEALHAELRSVDPAAAARIHPRNGERLVRALELVSLGGSLDEQWRSGNPTAPRFPAPIFGVRHPRPALNQRIDERTPRMLDGGWIPETERLLESGFDSAWPAYRTLGYPEIVEHIGGRLCRVETIEAIRVATRRFAKRQDTWFRGQPDVEWIEGGAGPDGGVERLSAALEATAPLPVPEAPQEP